MFCGARDDVKNNIKNRQMDALDKYMFGEACHPAFDIALRIENYTGVTMKNKLNKGSSSSALVSEGRCNAVRP